jgi:hypothetical protein
MASDNTDMASDNTDMASDIKPTKEERRESGTICNEGFLEYFLGERTPPRRQVIERRRPKKQNVTEKIEAPHAQVTVMQGKTNKRKVTDSDSESDDSESDDNSFFACCKRGVHRNFQTVKECVYVPAPPSSGCAPKCAVSWCHNPAQKQVGFNVFALCCSAGHQQRFEKDHAEQKEQKIAALEAEVAALKAQIEGIPNQIWPSKQESMRAIYAMQESTEL